ncbi:MAG TPA: UvrD-helicase domain-containing protein, partial [bacterium]
MKFVADLHLHSHYSRATSKNLNLEHLSKWAQLKGVQVVGTGDIAHPGWLAEMQTKLIPAEEGLFCLKEEYAGTMRSEVFKACRGTVRFMLAGEISNIYKKHDKVRKIHHVVFFPSFAAVEKFQARLEKIGNIRSDGRPILGLDSRDLLEIVLETDPQGYLIPAHIWTPWFALLGSMSGFDAVEECFDDLTPHIFALETGLSSDPPMNWRLSALDRYTLVSNSDAHSPQKLAREANIFNTELSYPHIFEALKTGDLVAFGGTIEFFPEEGKYHYDGHRKCRLRWNPKETIQHKGVCQVCGKPVTVGVMHRVEKLADRDFDYQPNNRHPYRSLIALSEILAEMYGTGVSTKRVTEAYEALLAKLGPELEILMQTPLEEITRIGGTPLAEGIRRMRTGEIEIAAGYDGEYGIIHLFSEDEREHFSSQLGFFELPETASQNDDDNNPGLNDSRPARSYETAAPALTVINDLSIPAKSKPAAVTQIVDAHPLLKDLNSQQRQTVLSTHPALMIIAGPGTGKTNTLTRRIAYLVDQKRAAPENILALTFTNKAADEMQHRLNAWLGADIAATATIKTFHGLGAMIVKEHAHLLGYQSNFAILDEKERARFLKSVVTELSEKDIGRYLNLLSHAKNQLLAAETISSHNDFKDDPQFVVRYSSYQAALLENNCLDFDDLIFQIAQLFERFPECLTNYQNRYRWIFFDEYQDVNFAQYQVLRNLVTPQTQLCVIGDPDQSIYGFRGARREFFLRFREDFPEAKVISLDKSYRSPQLILDAATQMIASASDSQTKRLLSNVLTHDKVQIYCAPTDKAEAEYVVHEIEKMVGGTSYFSLDSGRVNAGEPTHARSFADFAVLYRLHAQSATLEEAVQRSGIPFQTIGETLFFERPGIKAIVEYLWFLLNTDSDFHLQAILLGSGSGLSESAARRIMDLARARSIQLWTALMAEASDPRQEKQKADLVQKLSSCREFVPGKSVSQIIARVIEIFFGTRDLSDKHKHLFERLILKAKPFADNLAGFLQMSALCSATDEYDPRSDRVTLMTLHAAKGLEFPVVFIIGCEENIIPYQKSGAVIEVDEERRLLYVGMTRAKGKLILVHSKSRVLFGQRMKNGPSPFLSDIENRLKEIQEMRVLSSKRGDVEPGPQMSL